MGVTKFNWITAHAQCPACTSRTLKFKESGFHCDECNSLFPSVENAVNFITDDMKQLFNIVPTKNISDHPYDQNAQTIIDDLNNTDGFILDCGSGYKKASYPHVIQMEVVNYPNVNILAVNQKLPFVDCCFDAVFSLDVLEHVDDPFACAREIARVLKPEGVLYIDLPFLQAEHGYPHHYFNATRMGLLKLFSGLLEPEKHYVPLSGHPIFTLTQFLNIYVTHLPEQERASFRQLTVADLIAKDPTEWLSDPVASNLPEHARWLIASTTQAILRKPA